jgi:hypothetical protein
VPAFNFSETVYLQAQNTFGRPVTITPLMSQPAGQPYAARGIFEMEAMDVAAMDGSIISETRIILDVRDAEFTVVPLQGDEIFIPESNGVPAEGLFVVTDGDPDGGGETTLTLRRIVQAKP